MGDFQGKDSLGSIDKYDENDTPKDLLLGKAYF